MKAGVGLWKSESRTVTRLGVACWFKEEERLRNGVGRHEPSSAVMEARVGLWKNESCKKERFRGGTSDLFTSCCLHCDIDHDLAHCWELHCAHTGQHVEGINSDETAQNAENNLGIFICGNIFDEDVGRT